MPAVRSGGMGLLLLGILLGTGARAQPTSDSTSWIQVRLHHQADIESVRLSPERGTLTVQLPGNDAAAFELSPADTVTLGRRQSDVYAQHGKARLYARALRLTPASEATWTLTLPPESTRNYSGSLRLSRAEAESALQLVNRAPLTDYVASVVESEYGFDDQAGARAMAVVARTYGLFSTKKKFDGEYDHVDGTASQVYRGLNATTETARAAAHTTRGEILTYKGAPIQAVYFSSSGGHTANNEDVWTDSDPLPYLRGKKDPYDEPSPKHRWSTQVDRRSLLQALTLHEGTSVDGFLLDERSPDGRLRTIKILHSDGTQTKIEATTFRSIVNEGVQGTPLKSTWFEARRDGSKYVFDGRGHGHGVGLNQWGTHTMAQRGKSYREILSFYYTGVQIQQLEEVDYSFPAVVKDPAVESDSTSSRVGW